MSDYQPTTAEGRHEQLLWEGPVSYPAPVIRHVLIEDGFLMEDALDDDTARRDDAFWAKIARLPFSWQRFTNWWVARRWVRPRDITKE